MTALASTAADRPRYYRIADAARSLYPVPNHPATVTRHILRGVKLRDGSTVKLAALRTPGGWLVTAEAVDEFISAITRDRCGDPTAPTPDEHRPPAFRRRAVEAAERELERAGV